MAKMEILKFYRGKKVGVNINIAYLKGKNRLFEVFIFNSLYFDQFSVKVFITFKIPVFKKYSFCRLYKLDVLIHKNYVLGS